MLSNSISAAICSAVKTYELKALTETSDITCTSTQLHTIQYNPKPLLTVQGPNPPC